jgi:hypothetical protein
VHDGRPPRTPWNTDLPALSFLPELFPDGRLLASAGPDGTVILWDPATGKEQRRLRGHQGQIGSAGSGAFSADGKRLVTGGWDATVRTWDVATGKELGRFQDGNRVILAAALSPDGKTLASAASAESFIRLRDAVSGKELRRIEVAACYVCGLEFSPDGRTLALAGVDGSVRLVELVTGKERRCLRGHQGEATAVAFSRDGRLLASASWDTTVLVWDLAGCVPLKLVSLEAAWNDLADEDAARAYRGMENMMANREQAVLFLRRHLRPVPVLTSQEQVRLIQLVNDLGSDHFRVRQQASEELDRFGEAAVAYLRTVLQNQPPLETRRRVQRLLEKHEGWTLDRLRTVRAVEILERLETPESMQLLRTLAAGCGAALVATESKAALERLRKTRGQRP